MPTLKYKDENGNIKNIIVPNLTKLETPIDGALSILSSNAVENKVVTIAMESKAEKEYVDQRINEIDIEEVVIDSDQPQNDEWKLWVDTDEESKINNLKLIRKDINVTENWTGDSAPFTQTINIEEINENDVVYMYPVWSSDIEARKLEKQEYNKISMINSIAGGIELICDEEKPNQSLNVRIEVTY